jgi:HK97 family phage portal protein
MPNDDAQLLESRRFELTELGRYFGVPPFLLFDHEKSTTWGSGLEQQMLGFINVDLHPTWLGPTEQRITKELLGNGLEARYDMRDIMRGDSVARANYYQVMFGLGGLNANEIRFDEDLPPVEGGDEYLKPTVEVPVGPTPVIGGSAVSDSPQT